MATIWVGVPLAPIIKSPTWQLPIVVFSPLGKDSTESNDKGLAPNILINRLWPSAFVNSIRVSVNTALAINCCKKLLLLYLCSILFLRFLQPFSIVSPTYMATLTSPKPSNLPNVAKYKNKYSIKDVLALPRKATIKLLLYLEIESSKS